MTVSVDNPEAKLADLVDKAAAGEEVIIEKNGQPVARLVIVEDPERRAGFGSMKGKIWIADDFDAPLPDEVLRDFGMID